ATLLTAVLVACGGGSSATDTEPTEANPTVTVTPSTPVSAPPWTTQSPTTGGAPSETPGTLGAQPTMPDGTSPPATATSTPPPPTATATPTTEPAPMLVTVSVQDNKFVPPSVTVGVGGTVRWVVDGAAKHDVSGPGFDSGLLGPGESFEWTFAVAGGYTYECEIHNIPGTAARMTGRVMVE
ncbi:MAG: hypothetical protein ACRDHF_18310, partial [Tepidiformaceae bacterium]